MVAAILRTVQRSSELETTRVLLRIDTMTTAAMALADDWTEAKCLELIREYRRKPMLWDKKNRFFFRRNMKPIAWEEIGDALNIPADQCKHKMNVLMSSFRREKARLVNSLKNLTDDNCTGRTYL